MSYQNILYEIKEKIAYVTINRPKLYNALDAKTMIEIHGAFANIRNDENVGGVILTGAGEKAFVAGADINELASHLPIGGKEYTVRGQAILNFIEELGKPVIAAVNGFALGGGCELALACHIRIASDNAKFGQPEVNLGIIPGYGGTQRLARIVGKGRAMQLVLTGDMIDAQEAYRIGLVNGVVPQKDLMAECEKMLKLIMTKGPIAVKLAIEAINHGLEMSLKEGLNLEANLFGMTCATEDMREGTKAFLEKREAKFNGK